MDDLSILLEKADEKVRAADTLLENELYSDAVSRAYYGMFFAARALLSTKEIYPKSHKGVITELGREFVKTNELSQDAFELFSSSQEDREEADYGLLAEITEKEAMRIVNGSKRFIDEIRKILCKKQ